MQRGHSTWSNKAQDLIQPAKTVLKAGVRHEEAYLCCNSSILISRAQVILEFIRKIGQFAAYPEVAHPSFLDWMSIRSATGKFGAACVLQIVEVIAFLHKRGSLYNDFKPEHFLIAEEEITVIDLGLCRVFEKMLPQKPFPGTFPYISPERMTGKPFDERSDIFALGMMLLHAFLPNENWNFNITLYAVKTAKPSQKTSSLRVPSFQNDGFLTSQRIGSAAELWKGFYRSLTKRISCFSPHINPC